nr:agamous-like MADS-box protein AGL62 [Tanacetum cinerariifolium]
MVIVNNMSKKTSQGRKKIEIKKIEENSSRQVTFSKRRNGLFKKAAELCVLTGAKIAIIVSSPGGRVFAFGHPNADALINTYLAIGKDADVDLDVGRSAFPTNEFNQHYDEVSRELELEKKRKDMIPEKTSTEFWYDEPIDGMDVAELEQYLSSLQELNRKVLTHVDELMMMNNAPALFGSNLNNNTLIQGPNVLQHLQGQGPNVLQGLQGPNVVQGLQGPNVLSPQGPYVFDNAWKYYNGQTFQLLGSCDGLFHERGRTSATTQVKCYIPSYIGYELGKYRTLWEKFALCMISDSGLDIVITEKRMALIKAWEENEKQRQTTSTYFLQKHKWVIWSLVTIA